MSNLGERMRKAREFTREVGGIKLVMRRPSRMEYARYQADKVPIVELAKRYVIGWEGVTEADLVPSGGSDVVAFDADAWHELLAERQDLWSVGEIIEQEFWSHWDKAEERAGN